MGACCAHYATVRSCCGATDRGRPLALPLLSCSVALSPLQRFIALSRPPALSCVPGLPVQRVPNWWRMVGARMWRGSLVACNQRSMIAGIVASGATPSQPAVVWVRLFPPFLSVCACLPHSRTPLPRLSLSGFLLCPHSPAPHRRDPDLRHSSGPSCSTARRSRTATGSPTIRSEATPAPFFFNCYSEPG